MRYAKTAGLALLVALLTLAAGYLWGAAGRGAALDRLAIVERHAELSEARRLVLAGQLALTRLNFGDAAGLFESARAAADVSASALRQSGRQDEGAEVARAAQVLTEARGLSAKLDQGSAGRAGDALAILDRVAVALPAAGR